MRRSFWNRRIPTLLGMILIIFGVGITSFLVKSGGLLTSNAGPTDAPQNVTVSNVTDTSLTISYTTVDNFLGSVSYGTTKSLGQISLDGRDGVGANIAPHRTHYFVIKNLAPNTPYYFSIISGATTYLHNGLPYQAATGPSLATSSQNTDLSGKVSFPDGSPVADTLIYATIPGADTVMAIPKSDGSYTLPLSMLRTSDLSSYAAIVPSAKIALQITNGLFNSNVSFTPQDSQDIPMIVLSKDYDFGLASPTATTSAIANLPLAFSLSDTKTPARQVTFQISSPKKDQGFTDAQPRFQGTAAPNSSVSITIHSTEAISAQVTTDAFGNWTYRPTTPLSPGTHTITMQSKDANGITKTLTQTFVVFASGSQVNQTATPSATLTPTVTPSPTVAATPTVTSAPAVIVTPSPTIAQAVVITLTPTPTVLTPTAIITQAPVANNTTKGGLQTPVTGNESILVMGIVGITTTCIGIFLLLLSRGGTA